jgi:hypothetical protein
MLWFTLIVSTTICVVFCISSLTNVKLTAVKFATSMDWAENSPVTLRLGISVGKQLGCNGVIQDWPEISRHDGQIGVEQITSAWIFTLLCRDVQLETFKSTKFRVSGKQVSLIVELSPHFISPANRFSGCVTTTTEAVTTATASMVEIVLTICHADPPALALA